MEEGGGGAGAGGATPGRSSSSEASSSRPTLLITLLVALALGLGFVLTGAISSTRASRTFTGAGGRARDRVLLGNGEEYIRQACHATSSPEVCVRSIAGDSRSRQGFSSAYRLIELAVEIASGASAESLRLSRGILGGGGGDKNLSAAARDCVQVLELSASRYKKCLDLFSPSTGFSVKDLEAWLSSIEAHQNDCFSALGYVNSSRNVQNIMVQVQHGIYLISNALSMADALDSYGLNVSKWQPVHSGRKSSSKPGEAAGASWEWIQRSKLESFNQQLKTSAVVGKDAAAEYSSIQQAIDDAPSNSNQRYMIRIMAGVYNERVFIPESKTKIMLVGEGADKTIITGDDYVVQYSVNTMDTSTMLVAGDDFIARDLTIRNTAGPELHQAVALRIDADRVIIDSCSLIGFQDTLYSHTLRHYFVNSTIAGTVDFIFGNSAAFFSDCKLLVRQGREGIYTTMVTAHGRIDPAQTTGFVFHNCVVDAAPDFKPNPTKYKTYLGRPWKMYSRTVYESCYLGSIVAPEGWLPWKGDFALDTLFYGEYESSGPGGDDLTRRVPWSTQMSASQVPDYSVHSFIQGDSWIFHQ